MKTILITGSSTGIGKSCALHLDKLGFKVFAGVRKQSDGDNLKEEASGKLIPVILDVTDDESIRSAVNTITKENGGELFGLVNNAGIGISGALEVTPVEEVRKVMEVNVIGLLAVTRAMMPLLRKSNGRIINIGSSSSFVALPGASVYAGSKYAVRAITDSLRLELKHLGISSILIAPGAVESELWEKRRVYRTELRKTIKPEIAGHYKTLAKFGDKIDRVIKKTPAIEVAKAVEDALTSSRPKLCYPVGNDAKSATKAYLFPKRFLDWAIMKRIGRLAK